MSAQIETSKSFLIIIPFFYSSMIFSYVKKAMIFLSFSFFSHSADLDHVLSICTDNNFFHNFFSKLHFFIKINFISLVPMLVLLNLAQLKKSDKFFKHQKSLKISNNTRHFNLLTNPINQNKNQLFFKFDNMSKDLAD